MEWGVTLLIILGSFSLLMASGTPVAFCFLTINIVGVYLMWGGAIGLEELSYSIVSSLATFSLEPLPLFILMGEVAFHSGLASLIIETLDRWLGRVPGRLSLLSVGAGTLFSTLTGSSLASVALLGSVLVPVMEKRSYKKSMSLGPIMGSGGLAAMIPPSSLAVLIGVIGEISVGAILIAIIIPGLVMAGLYAIYIIARCKIDCSLAPAYEVEYMPLLEKIKITVFYVLPVGVIIFLVIGLIILGIATPSEAAATGTVGTFIIAAAYGKLNWKVLVKSLRGTLQVTVMVFVIIMGAKTFSQVMAFSGVTKGLFQFTLGTSLSPIAVIICMQVLLLILGCFMEVISIMMLTMPLFMPLVRELDINQVWFAVVFLVNLEVAVLTPPFGLHLFVMKGVAPDDTTMADIIKAAVPFMGLALLAMVLVMIFPQLALWLPSLMRR